MSSKMLVGYTDTVLGRRYANGINRIHDCYAMKLWSGRQN